MELTKRIAIAAAWVCIGSARGGEPSVTNSHILRGTETTRPNILLILADDMGYADLSVQGCKEFSTPHIDSIAGNGVRFTQGYVCNSVCAPSRAGLLSGRIGIGFEANLPDDPEIGLDTGLQTMADTLKRAGYATSCIGKWHLGEADRYYPTRRGFDYFCGLRSGSRSYFYDEKGSDAPHSPARIELNGTQVTFEGYLTDYFTDNAIEVIASHTEATPGKPFFMYLSYTAPHAPMHAKPEIIKRFTNIRNEKRRIYAAMVTSLDEGVGRVLRTLEKSGLRDSTLVVFLSDNGGPTFKNGSSNRPLKGRKGTVWEGGMRVPFMLQWAGRIPAGQVRDDPVSSLDLLPTFARLAGVGPPENMSGIDLTPYLTGGGKTIGERRMFWRRGGMKNCALRSGRFKWVADRNKVAEYLYDLEKDIGEENDLFRQKPGIAEALRREYVRWESTVPDPAFASGWNAEKEARKQAERRAYEKQLKE